MLVSWGQPGNISSSSVRSECHSALYRPYFSIFSIHWLLSVCSYPSTLYHITLTTQPKKRQKEQVISRDRAMRTYSWPFHRLSVTETSTYSRAQVKILGVTFESFFSSLSVTKSITKLCCFQFPIYLKPVYFSPSVLLSPGSKPPLFLTCTSQIVFALVAVLHSLPHRINSLFIQ